MSDEAKATPDAPKSAAKSEPKKAAEPEPGRFAAYVADLPDPFRPRHLDEAIRLHAAENGIVGEALAKVDPHKFLKEHGLPNPLKRFRIVATKKEKTLDPEEFDAVDTAEAARLFAEKHGLKETHQWRFQHFLLDY